MSRQSSLCSLPETECEWNHQGSEAVAFAEPPKGPNLHEDAGVESSPCPALGGAASAPRPDMAAPLPQPSTILAGATGDLDPTGQVEHQPLFFQVAFLGGIEVRAAPDFEAARTGMVLQQGDVFAVSQRLAGRDGRIYLSLTDGQGWVFDDAALMPHDPSVVLLPYAGPLGPPLSAVQAALDSGQTCPNAPPPFPNVVLPPLFPVSLTPTATRGEPCALAPPSATDIPAAVAGGAVNSRTEATPVSWFRVAYLGGINLRCAPSYDAPLTGTTLPQMETFPACEEISASDGRVYLRLCDGRGWAFDDSVLMPHDPSVRRGQWLQAQADTHFVAASGPEQSQSNPWHARRHRAYPQPRGKRGGKRCAKRAAGVSAQVRQVAQR